MRLGQLARKLSVRTADIVAFLASRNIDIAAETNTRIDDDHLPGIIDHFDPQRLVFTEAVGQVDAPDIEQHDVQASVETAAVADPPGATPEMAANDASTGDGDHVAPAEIAPAEASGAPAEPEVIKAVKVALPGLRVVGKIELPEPKKPTEKDEPANDGEVSEEQKVRGGAREGIGAASTERKDRITRRQRFDKKQKKNPVTAQREKQLREAERKREEALLVEKEKRTIHYMKKVKSQGSAKYDRLYDEPVAEADRAPEAQTVAPAPGSWWGRFFRWLRRED